MMKKVLTFFAVLLVAMGATAQKKVAVYTKGDVDAAYKKVIGAKMVAAITRSEGFSAVERTADFMAAMQDELGYQRSGAVSDRQIAKLGVQFGVRYVVVLDVSDLFGEIFVESRMIDVQTAEILHSVDETMPVDNMSSLTSISESVARKLLSGLEAAEKDAKNKREAAQRKQRLQEMYRTADIKPILLVTNQDVYNYSSKIPTGYRVMTTAEVQEMIEAGIVLKYPIYTDINPYIRPEYSTKYSGSGKNRESYQVKAYDKYYIDYTVFSNAEAEPHRYSLYVSFYYYYDGRGWRDIKTENVFMYVIKKE